MVLYMPIILRFYGAYKDHEKDKSWILYVAHAPKWTSI